MADFQSVVGKAVTDAEFCKKLVKDPEGTLKAAGVKATPEMVNALKSIDANAVQKLAAAFKKDQAA
jgi:hypothetical protein